MTGEESSTEEIEQAGRTEPAKDWFTKLFEDWSGLITTAGAAAGVVAGYQLTKDLGSGDLSGGERAMVLLATAAFALGIGLLITIPVSLRTRNRVMLSDAVAQQRRWNVVNSYLPDWIRLRVIPPSSLLGYEDLVAFDDANLALINEAREAWTRGRAPQPDVTAKLNIFSEQRENIESAVATKRLRQASRVAVWRAGVAMVLTVTGYSTAALITNMGIRDGKQADETIAHARKLEEKILDDELAAPGALPLIPAISSELSVTFPSNTVAAAVLGTPAKKMTTACAKARRGTAVDVAIPPRPIPRTRILQVAFPKTKTCPAASGWVKLDWIDPAEPAT